MTLAEFKAWLDGYSEAVGEAPNAEQWKRIQEKLATVGIDGIGLGAYPPPPRKYTGAPLVGGAGGYVPQTLTGKVDFVRDWETVAISN